MSEVIVVTSGKGGVGKTTTTANIGVGLAQLDKRVVLIDTDIGLRNLDVLMGLENRVVYNLVDVVEGKCDLQQALLQDKKLEKLFLLPSAQTREKSDVTPEQIRALTEELKKDFDYIILDCPAGIEEGFRNAIAGADRAIVVTTPVVSSVRDADRIIGLLDQNHITDVGLVVNSVRYEMVKRGEMLSVDDIFEILGRPILGAVPDDERVIMSVNRGEPVTGTDCMAGKAFENISRRIIGEEVPLLDLEVKLTFRQRWRMAWAKD